MKNSFSRLLMVFLSMLFALLPLGTRASDQIQWRTLGPGGGGNMVSAAVSPVDPNIVLMGSDVGGIFRSTDGGVTWQMRNNAYVDPTRHGVYEVKGFTWDTGPGRTDIVYQGTLKSTDAGNTWQEKVFPRQAKWIGAIDPTDHNIVYLAGYAGQFILRSDCAFESCPVQESFLPGPDCTPACGSPVPGGGIDQTCCFGNPTVHALVVNPAAHTQVLACTPWGLYKSDTSQNPWTWIKVSPTTGLPHDECDDLVIHPSTHVMYMTLATHRDIDALGPLIDTWKGGVYKSVDCGSWGSCWQEVNGTEGTNLLSNPSFETLAPPYPAPQWSSPDSNVTQVCNDPLNPAKDGACAIKIESSSTAGTGGSIHSPVIPIQDGVTYRVSGWAKVDYTSCVGLNQQPFQGSTTYYEDSAATIQVFFPQNWPENIYWSNIWNDSNLHYGWRHFETRIRPLDRAAFMTFDLIASCGTGSVGTTWIDQVELTPVAGLPGIGKLPPTGGQAHLAQHINYLHIVVDSQNDQVAYVGTGPNLARGIDASNANFQLADTAGIWKTEDGGTTWRLTTNTSYRDNVLDGIVSAPSCGNGICEGRGEDCTTCQTDCIPGLPYCCGNRKATPPAQNVCETAAGENRFNCRVDCPEYEDPTRPYFESKETSYQALSLAIGSGPTGHDSLYFGMEHYVTHDGGLQWTETSSDWTQSPPPPMQRIPPLGSWKARGDTNGVLALPVLTWPPAVPPDPALEMRLFYGDRDNYLQASFDKGFSFSQAVSLNGQGSREWHDLTNSCTAQPLFGQSVTALLPDPADQNVIYAGVSAGELGGCPQCNANPDSSGCSCIGVVKGVFDPAMINNKPWTWSAVGNIKSVGQGGGVDLARATDGTFFASAFTEGVFRHAGNPGDCANWESLKLKSWLPAPPEGWYTYKIAYEPTANKLYVSAGNPYVSFGENPSAAATGVWESVDEPGPTVLGDVWNKITLNTPALDGESITALLPDGPDTLFLTTNYPDEQAIDPPGFPDPPNPLPHGGVYKGEKNGGNWTFTRVLPRMDMTGIAISPADSSILYAFAGQACCFSSWPIVNQDAGIWKSIDSGKSGTWVKLANIGLSHLIHGRLTFSRNDPKLLYASTQGGGVYEGTISCTDPVRDFECSTRLNPSNPQIIDGTSISGSVQDLASGTMDHTNQVFTESGGATTKKLTVAWTFTGAQQGISYDLRVEGSVNSPSNDSFIFSYVRSSGTCTGSEANYTDLAPAVSITTSDDKVQNYSLGALASGNTVFCIKVKDNKTTGDSQPNTLNLDRVYLVPSPPEAVATSDTPPNPGTILAGSYVDTSFSDDQYEVLKEGLQSGKSKLNYVWQFSALPTGQSHKLHVEGHRPSNSEGDNFQFSYSTNGTTYMTILNALISTTSDVAGGTDYTFGSGGLSGTIYIRVQDTNQSSGSALDTVYVDHLTIRTVP